MVAVSRARNRLAPRSVARYSTLASVRPSASCERATCRETISPAASRAAADGLFLAAFHLEIELGRGILLVLLIELRGQYAAGRLPDRLAKRLIRGGYVGDGDLECCRLAGPQPRRGEKCRAIEHLHVSHAVAFSRADDLPREEFAGRREGRAELAFVGPLHFEVELRGDILLVLVH